MPGSGMRVAIIGLGIVYIFGYFGASGPSFLQLFLGEYLREWACEEAISLNCSSRGGRETSDVTMGRRQQAS
jgi:hypothetical protein